MTFSQSILRSVSVKGSAGASLAFGARVFILIGRQCSAQQAMSAIVVDFRPLFEQDSNPRPFTFHYR
jgi:hypothetical protein